MKNGVLLSLIVLPALAFAQFPEPLSFQVSVNYIHLGESDWCDNPDSESSNIIRLRGSGLVIGDLQE